MKRNFEQVTRKNIRAEALDVKKVKVNSGRTVYLCSGKAGDISSVSYDHDVPRGMHPRLAIILKGKRRQTAGDGGFPPQVQSAGYFSSDGPNLKADVEYSFELLEDTEFLCISNTNDEPLVFSRVLVPAGGEMTVPAGFCLVVAFGETDLGPAPQVYHGPGEAKVRAIQAVSAVLFQ